MNVRKNALKLTAAERQNFTNAINRLNSGPQPTRYAQFVAVHLANHHQHGLMPDGTDEVGVQRFLTWHRAFLLEFERALQQIDPTVTVPYWNWMAPNSRRVPPWLAQVTPTVNVPAPSGGGHMGHGSAGATGAQVITVFREEGAGGALPSATWVKNFLLQPPLTFTLFTSRFEGVHGMVHNYVGGTMATFSSPADPVFWMHHAQCDRLWAGWQAKVANAGKWPSLANAAATMDPWNWIATELRSIQERGYSYQ